MIRIKYNNTLYAFLLLISFIIVESLRMETSMLFSAADISERIKLTERPYIEDVLDKYSYIKNLTAMALGSSHWQPPEESLIRLVSNVCDRDTHRYGSIEGFQPLRESLKKSLYKKGLFTDDLDIVVTAGANQAFINIALTLCDNEDDAVILAPYYFSHKLSLQLVGAKVHVCPFDNISLRPDWNKLNELMETTKPKMIVLTSPNNPSGVVWSLEETERLIDMCKRHNTWLVCDQTYHEFTFGEAVHVFPCAKRFGYGNIIHIFSMSKSFGMPGWRVGYIAYPKQLNEHMRKIQDTIPTHATMLSQKLAIHCLDINEEHESTHEGITWVDKTVASLVEVRDCLWPILSPFGTHHSQGAFYFLVPLPAEVSEEEAVEILATEFQVLLMLGSPFGAEGYLRLSYGGIPPAEAIKAAGRLQGGFDAIAKLADVRRKEKESLKE